MSPKLILGLCLLFLAVGLMFLPHNFEAQAKQSKASSKIEKTIEDKLSKLVKDDYTKYCGVFAKYKPLTNNTVTVYNGSANCMGTPGPGPGPGPTPIKIPPLNKSTTIRIGAFGDVDCNKEQTKENDLMKTYQVQYIGLAGDFDYNDAQCVFKDLANHGYNNGNVALGRGNHESCSTTQSFTKAPKCWYHFTVANGTVEFFVLEGANIKSGAQYDDVKSWLESSHARYKIVVIHEPFITAASNHGKNGQYATYHTLFVQYHVTLVLQAHNHNWQHFVIDGIDYDVVGTGTHDLGDKLYSIDSSNDGLGHPLIKGFDNKNGVTIYDLNIANSTDIHHGYFVDINNNLLYAN